MRRWHRRRWSSLWQNKVINSASREHMDDLNREHNYRWNYFALWKRQIVDTPVAWMKYRTIVGECNRCITLASTISTLKLSSVACNSKLYTSFLNIRLHKTITLADEQNVFRVKICFDNITQKWLLGDWLSTNIVQMILTW